VWKVKSSWHQIPADQRLIRQETEKWTAKPINARRTIMLQTSYASVATRPDEIVKLIEEATSCPGRVGNRSRQELLAWQ
jgi:hypothetical protein